MMSVNFPPSTSVLLARFLAQLRYSSESSMFFLPLVSASWYSMRKVVANTEHVARLPWSRIASPNFSISGRRSTFGAMAALGWKRISIRGAVRVRISLFCEEAAPVRSPSAANAAHEITSLGESMWTSSISVTISVHGFSRTALQPSQIKTQMTDHCTGWEELSPSCRLASDSGRRASLGSSHCMLQRLLGDGEREGISSGPPNHDHLFETP